MDDQNDIQKDVSAYKLNLAQKAAKPVERPQPTQRASAPKNYISRNTRPQRSPRNNDEQGKADSELSKTTSIFMITVAVIIDIVQFFVGFLDVILIGTPINWAINIGVWVLYFFWFNSHGISFTAKPKRIVSFGLGTILKLIPIVNMLPAWTTAIVVIIGTTKADTLKALPGGTVAASVASKIR